MLVCWHVFLKWLRLSFSCWVALLATHMSIKLVYMQNFGVLALIPRTYHDALEHGAVASDSTVLESRVEDLDRRWPVALTEELL